MTNAGPRLAVVTGASSGIGQEIARVLSRGGHPVLAVARRAEPLASLAEEARRAGHGPIHPLARDLRKPGATAAIAARAGELGGAGWIVNCAGAFSLQPFARAASEELAQVTELNVLAPVLLTRALLPQLLAAEDAHVLNVGSLAAMQPCPWFATYGASKAFLVSFSEALAEELRGRVAVTAFCPGPVRTGIFDAAMPAVERRPMLHDLEAAEAARAAVQAARRGCVVAIPGRVNRLAAFLARFAPRGLVRRMSRELASRYLGYRPPAP